MNSIKIVAVSYYLPERVVTNEDLAREYPDWDIPKLSRKTGVSARHIAEEGETAFDLGLRACNKLIENHSIDTATIDAVVFCTQTPDYIMPYNAALLHGELGLRRDVRAFDISLACSGYTYCLDVARGMAATGAAQNILIVTADTYSKLIHPGDRSVRTLFGDGAAATLTTATSAHERGVIDVSCGTYGLGADRFIVEAGGCRTPRDIATRMPFHDANGNVRSRDHIRMDGLGVLSFFNSTIPQDICSLLARNDLAPKDVTGYVFHQASEMAIGTLQKALKLEDGMVVRAFSDTGNLVSASIPTALARSIDDGRFKQGDLLVLSGFGVGLSWSNVLMRY